ncbi:MAG: hypothetical protein ABIW76_07895 [Fibrobacteria bacterium]
MEKIRVTLEDFLKKSGKDSETKERIFAYKYLGVIYAAEPQGYPLAETYFYQLLSLAPNAHISDLYASASVEDVFIRTRERFRNVNKDISEFDEFGNPRNKLNMGRPAVDTTLKKQVEPSPKPGPISPKGKPLKKESRIRVWPWVVGIGVVGAVAGYFWFSTEEKAPPTRIPAN